VKPIKTAFELVGVTLPLTAIHPIRQIRPADAAWGKYRAVLASIREVGVIEPLAVYPQKGSGKTYLLLDGHMRLKALKELGRTDAFCLIATEDDAFTYNDKVNGLSLIQEHAMIMRAINVGGVTATQIAKALDVDVAKVKASMNLLDGIHLDAVELLKDKPISSPALRLFRKAKAVRQIDMAQLMVSANNYTRAYAEALVIGTPGQHLVDTKKPKLPGISHDEIARMEKEMEVLERDYRLHQEQFGENSLHLNGVQRYVKRLLNNAKVKRFLSNRFPEILEEFQELAALETL
jgi:hypothetical protein